MVCENNLVLRKHEKSSHRKNGNISLQKEEALSLIRYYQSNLIQLKTNHGSF